MPYSCNVLGPVAGVTASVVAISPPVVTLASTIGTFFAPNAAAAAGGMANIIGASAAGSLITFIPGTIGIIIAGLLMITGINTGSEKLMGVAVILGAIDLACTYIFAAQIGAGITGVAASSIMFFNMIGAAAMLLGLALGVGVLVAAAAACLSTFAEGVAPGSLRR